MKILERKGYVKHRAEGRAFVYDGRRPRRRRANRALARDAALLRRLAASARAEPDRRRSPHRSRARRARSARSSARRTKADGRAAARRPQRALARRRADRAGRARAPLGAAPQRHDRVRRVERRVRVVALLPALDLALARPRRADRSSRRARRSRFGSAPAPASPRPFRLHAIAAADAPVRPRRGDRPTAASTASRAGSLRVGGLATPFAHAWGIALFRVGIVAALLLLRLGRAYATLAPMKRHATPLADPPVLGRPQRAGHRRRARSRRPTHVTSRARSVSGGR